MNKTILALDSVRLTWEPDPFPPAREDYPALTGREFDEMALYSCRAVATVSYPTANGDRRIEQLSSGGLNGIERYFADGSILNRGEVEEQEELADLRAHLAVFGVPTERFDELANAGSNKPSKAPQGWDHL